ncbi:MAG: hypothetical protein IH796_07415 [Deltaproteobacteria bacterium]|nr:hypothetical protein [Deltaproteobacteria bacterium]
MELAFCKVWGVVIVVAAAAAAAVVAVRVEAELESLDAPARFSPYRIMLLGQT